MALIKLNLNKNRIYNSIMLFRKEMRVKSLWNLFNTFVKDAIVSHSSIS